MSEFNFEWPEVAKLQLILVGRVAIVEQLRQEERLVSEDLYRDPGVDYLVSTAIDWLNGNDQ